MVSYTTIGLSYTYSAPTNGGQMTVAPQISLSETITDTVSTNGEFNPGDIMTLSIGGDAGIQTTFLGVFTYDGQNYPLFSTSDSGDIAYHVIGLDETATGRFTASSTPCYIAGTAIETAACSACVENLRIGDILVTASGQHRPVKWIGRRSYAGPFLAANPCAHPIRFLAGSLGGGLPRRDLLVSPEHAMVIDGMLIPARCLVNGLTITTEHGFERVDYYHVELDSHDAILAEGAPSETFLDDKSRFAFHNAHEFAALYPNAAPPGAFCAPRLESGPVLDAIRRRLGGDGVQEWLLQHTGVHDIVLRPGAAAIRLTTETCFAPGDARRLGAAISRIMLDGTDLRLDDPKLATGWHGCEGAWRWTDGAALVVVAGATRLTVEVAQLPSLLAA